MATPRILLLLVAGIAGFTHSQCAAQHSDVLLQVVDGSIGIGSADFENGIWTIGERVFQHQLLSNFRANDPGFTALATGNPLLEAGVIGFPSQHDVFFDLLPMRVDSAVANVFFWDGTDFDGDGLSIDDVRFVVPISGVTWNIFDDGFNLFTADGSDAFVPGGLIQQASSDTNPGDGVDTGTLHQHLVIRVDDGDGNTQTQPPKGVYMVALQACSEGFETSDPFLFVHRTFSITNKVRDLAAAWADANYDSLFTPPGLAGDYDRDGSVDAADYVLWRATQGQVGAGLPADGDANGTIDVADYNVWRANFGATANISTSTRGREAAVVPEPGSIWLAFGAIGAAALTVAARDERATSRRRLRYRTFESRNRARHRGTR